MARQKGNVRSRLNRCLSTFYLFTFHFQLSTPLHPERVLCCHHFLKAAIDLLQLAINVLSDGPNPLPDLVQGIAEHGGQLFLGTRQEVGVEGQPLQGGQVVFQAVDPLLVP